MELGTVEQAGWLDGSIYDHMVLRKLEAIYIAWHFDTTLPASEKCK